MIIIYYIYKIENIKNSKKYIGLTNNIDRRRKRHFSDLKSGKHDNLFLQKEYDSFGEDVFTFTMLFQGEVTEQEIGEKEKDCIKYYDSFHNGYNQNEGGNFGASNGGSQLIQKDIFNILSVLEFASRSGQVLATMFGVSRTTISRINRGESHAQYKTMYEEFPLKERENIYKKFCEKTGFYENKINTTILKTLRHLNEEQVHCILYNFENRIIPIKKMA